MGGSLEVVSSLRGRFVWIDRHGGKHVPSDMSTRHLVHTVVMIWNHTCPQSHVTDPFYNRYTFRSPHTPEYLKTSVLHLNQEIASRELTPRERALMDRTWWRIEK